MQRYKELERRHYDAKAGSGADGDLALSGAAAIEPTLRAPYVVFEAAVREHAKPGDRVVDLGAGTGLHSLAAAHAAVRVPVDISIPALRLASERGRRAAIPLAPVVADAENLPLATGSVDLVTSAGALYCFDFTRICAEVRRVLKPDGTWVIVDSFDHNPVYRLNRRVGRLLGRRTKRAVENIPDSSWIAALERQFRAVDVRYFGTVAFLAPLLSPVLGGERTAGFVDRVDRALPGLRRYAFKVVIRASGPAPV